MVVAVRVRYSSLHLIQVATGLTLVQLIVGNLLHCKYVTDAQFLVRIRTNS